MGLCIRLGLSSSQALPLNQQVNGSLWERGVGVKGGSVSAHSQSVHREITLQHALKASRAWVEGKEWGQSEWDVIMSRRIMLLLPFPVPLFLPLYPLWHFLSLHLPPPVLLLPTSSLYLSVLSLSFTPYIFTSTLFPLPLSCPLLCPFPLCLPPQFWGNMASQSLCEK